MIFKNNTYKKLVIGSILINTILISQTAYANDENDILGNDTKIVDSELKNDAEKEDTNSDENLEKDSKTDLEEKEDTLKKMEKVSSEPQEEGTDEENLEQKYKENIKAWANSFAGNSYYDKDDEKMANLNEKMDTNVENTLKLVAENNENNFWTDIESYNQSKFITQSYRKIESLAKQYANPGSKYYKNENVKKVIMDALEWEYNKNYNENSYIGKGNWWDYEIGTPRAINNTLSLIYDDLDQKTINKYTKPINHFVPDPYRFRVTTGNPFNAKGGNLIDMGRVRIIAGFLQNDSEMVDGTIKALKQIYEIRDENMGSIEEGDNDGYYVDGSYVDHTNVAYNGAYGNVMLDGFSQLLPALTNNTSFDTNEVDKIHDIIDKSFLPFLHRTQMMDMVRGRSISREKLQPHNAGAEVIRSIMRIADASDEARKTKYNSFIKDVTTDNDYFDFSSNLNNFRDIFLYNKIKDQELEPIKKENKIHIFNNMDKLVYNNADKDYALGFSMHSSRIKNFEYMNGENSKGWYTSDGVVYLYNQDLSHYSDNYWATVDHSALPSITEIKETRDSSTSKKNDNTERLLKSSFVGATKLDEKNASLAMDFNNWNDDIRLKKSWFILGNRIVFLGSDIANPNSKKVYTSIENRKLKEADQYKVYVNDKVLEKQKTTEDVISKVFLESKNGTNENIGYYFLNNKNLIVEKEHRQASWSEVNKDGSKDKKENDFIKINQDHKDNTGYAYVMVPATSKNEFDRAPMDDIKILANTDKVQAVYDQKNNIWGISLFKDEKFKINDDLSLDKKGLYTIKKDSNKYVISYFDPSKTHTGDDLIVVKDGKTIKKPSHAKDYYIYELEHKKVDSKDNNDNKPGLDIIDDNKRLPDTGKTEEGSKEDKPETEKTEENITDVKPEGKKIEHNKIYEKPDGKRTEDKKADENTEANKDQKSKSDENYGSIKIDDIILDHKPARNTKANESPKTGVSSSIGYIGLLGASVLALFKKKEK
ncbi:polysaccharide lyase 8 family protein [Anaerococcus marasmi]|uniref:polysaccharide lyase 8 family protein n=1 Tax=Anaerococcus marasmi TaxID=2057797 RepID=UPI001319FF4E|nr:polysaccharide lyase 8 family protein [Anaerococcus marasmi]